MNKKGLLTINGQQLYLDLDEVSNFVKLDPNDIVHNDDEGDDDSNPSTMINITKYDLVRQLINVFIEMGFPMDMDGEPQDEIEKLVRGNQEVSEDFNNMSIPFKLAYNTLTINNILKTYEPTVRENKRSNSKS